MSRIRLAEVDERLWIFHSRGLSMESINEKKQMMTPSTPPKFKEQKKITKISPKHDAFADMSFRLQNIFGHHFGYVLISGRYTSIFSVFSAFVWEEPLTLPRNRRERKLLCFNQATESNWKNHQGKTSMELPIFIQIFKISKNSKFQFNHSRISNAKKGWDDYL